MDIVTGCSQIPVATALDNNCLAATAKDASEQLLPMVSSGDSLAITRLGFTSPVLRRAGQAAKSDEFKKEHGKRAEERHAEDDEHRPEGKDDRRSNGAAEQGVEVEP